MVELSHRDLGGEGKPPLVILHGLLGSSRNWQTAGRDLSSRYHVYALDARNHGLSPHADSMTYAEIADDVRGWLDRHGLGPVTLLGHSLGGKTAMALACASPERVSQLVVVDIAPKGYRWEAHRAEFAAMNELDLGGLKSRGEAELRFEARVTDWAMRKFLTTNLERDDAGKWRWQINLPVLTAALPILEGNPLAEDARYSGPATFIVGGKSRYVLEGDRPAILRHFPNARIETIPTSGHNPHMDAREAFVALVP
jgi:pimeloyl-ACP methyl ester carboxylesterase